jgi:hypothetical protein
MKDIVIARAVRNFEGGIAEVTLIWRGSKSKLGVEFIAVRNGFDTKRFAVPDHGVQIWLDFFTRDQTQLRPTAYLITTEPSPKWKTVLDFLESLC